MATGWAVSNISGVLLKTVSETKVAAAVNFLTAYCGILIYEGVTDEQVLEAFEQRKSRHEANLVPIRVEVLSG